MSLYNTAIFYPNRRISLKSVFRSLCILPWYVPLKSFYLNIWENFKWSDQRPSMMMPLIIKPAEDPVTIAAPISKNPDIWNVVTLLILICYEWLVFADFADLYDIVGKRYVELTVFCWTQNIGSRYIWSMRLATTSLTQANEWSAVWPSTNDCKGYR